jgi:hypothetical protein
MKLKRRGTNEIIKKARKGFRGYPIATVAYYGPDNQRATKVAVGIITHEDGEPNPLVRWYSKVIDVRFDAAITKQIPALIKEHQAVSVASVGSILGCPHEEVIDYPEGQSCPHCPFWANRDRWAGIGGRVTTVVAWHRRHSFARPKFVVSRT